MGELCIFLNMRNCGFATSGNVYLPKCANLLSPMKGNLTFQIFENICFQQEVRCVFPNMANCSFPIRKNVCLLIYRKMFYFPNMANSSFPIWKTDCFPKYGKLFVPNMEKCVSSQTCYFVKWRDIRVLSNVQNCSFSKARIFLSFQIWNIVPSQQCDIFDTSNVLNYQFPV